MKNKCTRAEPFIATRRQHLAEIAEDYVEIISDLISLKGKAKVCDIAKHVGVSHVTVIRTIERLKQKGYLLTERRQPITLTEKGIQLAAFCKNRHQFLVTYLVALGIPQDVAIMDAEGMEHHISPVTLEAFQRHLKVIEAQFAPLP